MLAQGDCEELMTIGRFARTSGPRTWLRAKLGPWVEGG
jgi:hypothetical protein